MKRLIPTLLAVVVLVIAFLYAQSQDFFRTPQIQQLPVVEFDPEQVTAFHILSENEENKDADQSEEKDKDKSKDQKPEIRIKLTEEGWQLTDSPTYPLDDSKIENWLHDLLVLKDDGVVEENPSGYADFGLEPPVYDVKLTMADGTEQIMMIGNELPVRGHLYLRKTDDEKIYRLEKETLNKINRDLVYFTDLRVMGYELSKIHSIEYSLGEQQWKLERQGDADSSFNAPWKLDGVDRKYTDISSILGHTIHLKSEQIPLSVQDMQMDRVHLQIVVEEYVGEELVEHIVVGEVQEDGEHVLLWEIGQFWGYLIKIDEMERLFMTGIDSMPAEEQ